MTNHTTAIEVAGLTKSYGDHTVLDGVDLTVPDGTVYALLGPNGAGKTTIVNILSTLLTRRRGRDPRRRLRRTTRAGRGAPAIGVTGQFSAIDELLTGRENLRLMADLAHLRPADGERRRRRDAGALRPRRRGRPAGATYSGGMKRRLDLAMTLIGRPRLIFLDEPTTGLDPRSRRDLWAIVRELVADGVTVLLTTQYLEEADQLADTVGVLDGGRLVAEGTPASSRPQAGGETARRRLPRASPATRPPPRRRRRPRRRARRRRCEEIR